MPIQSNLQNSLKKAFMAFTFAGIIASPLAKADEGMWTFNNPPTKQMKEKYNFSPDKAWFDHVRLSSVRFMDGGSGSFVSADGLVMTNHHVAVGQIQKLSTAERDLVTTGYYAPTQADELKTKDLELNVLIGMENVTAQVLGSVKADMNDDQAMEARKKIMNSIEKEAQEANKEFKMDVVSLYHGGEYWLYKYKKYTDVRLVFAPERAIAYFGGDNDNFTFPRYDLDITFFRVYEDGKPVKSGNFLKWSAKGAQADEMVIISGHPGTTNRLYTEAQLLYQRDYSLPTGLKQMNKRLEILHEYSKLGPEQERRALISIFGIANGQKSNMGTLEGLKNPELINVHKKNEEDLRKIISSNPELDKKYSWAWAKVEEIMKKQIESQKFSAYRNLSTSFSGYASGIVRFINETQKPDADRKNGYHEAQINATKARFLSPAPIYKDMEEYNLAGMLEMALQELGPNDEFIKIVLNGKSPKEVAKEMIAGTQMDNVDFRKELIEGGEKALKNCKDPFVILAQKLIPMSDEREKWTNENISAPLSAATQKIAEARFAAYGNNTYPDANFTLRLTYGSVKGYPMNGTVAPTNTTLYGLYDHSLSFGQQGDYKLPERYWQYKNDADLSTPVNFVSTCDIIGGNSGSPTINKNAEVVGIVFDGNIESLPGRFVYEASKNRAVSVHSSFILEALSKFYKADALVKELTK